jgi:hypothetical protein
MSELPENRNLHIYTLTAYLKPTPQRKVLARQGRHID